MGFARLVYSPKAFVYVKNANGQIWDLSAYTTSGSVQRKVNQLSTAQVTLRNPNMIFTDLKRGATFTPMDPITIYLQRLRNRPVRVFTGFLDQTPWLKLYPDTITLKASCTLKKLMYTFFDPALPYLNDFLRQYGWLNNGQGEIRNPESASQIYDATSNDPLKAVQSPDGSIGNLLFATLTNIGHWDPKTIFIQDLPAKKLVGRMAQLAHEWDEDNKQARKEFEGLLEAIIGSGSYGSGGGNDATINLGDSRVPENVYLVGKQMGVPKKYLLAAMMTGLVECPQGSTFGNCAGGTSDSAGWRQERASLYADPRNVPASAKRYYAECKQFDRGQSAGELAADVQRPAAQYRGRYEGVRAKAEALLQKLEGDYATKNPGKTDKATNDLTGTVIKKAGEVGQTIGKVGQPKIFAPIGKQGTFGRGWHEDTKGHIGLTNTSGSTHWHSGIDYGVPAGTACVAPTSGVITMALPSWSDGGMVHFKFTQDVGEIKAGTIIGWGHVQNIRVKVGDKVEGGKVLADSGSPGGGPHVHFIIRPDGTDGGGDGSADPTPLLTALQKGETAPTSGGNAANSSNGGGSSTEQMYSIAQATAFAAQLDWPSIEETTEAMMLQGQKSLMNDKPLMPFIEQLTEAGLRQFQSMPNGHFYAFYPDYFGEFGRKPYWMISDAEILDGGIDLNDEALATHVFVVGDTIPGGIDIRDKLLSGGVVNIFNAFMAGDTIVNRHQGPDDKEHASQRFTQLIGKSDAIKFLQRYGARPQLFEEPMIRSPYFEAFMAYQKFMLLWSRQFLSTFTFTFMPELFPGGKVGFPDHGLQCYIEEVEHTWDYESGFFTQASLSAPSVLAGASGDDLPPNMVVQQALYEPISNVTQVRSPHGGTFPVTPSPDALEGSPR